MYYELTPDTDKQPPQVPNWLAWIIVIVLLSALWECCNV